MKIKLESIFSYSGWASRYFIFFIVNLITVQMFQTVIELNGKTFFHVDNAQTRFIKKC